MERTPMKAPLPCFGLEHDPVDPMCRNCPHETECVKFMGVRAHKIPLDKLRFELAPLPLREKFNEDDPEVPRLRVLYADCYMTVFNKKAPSQDSPERYQLEIIKNARQAKCSLHMFILSNMVAHTISEETLIKETEKARPKPFYPKLLADQTAITRAIKYAKVCNDRYGTFSLTSLSTFSGEDFERNDTDRAMLNSEVIAGKYVVSRKIQHQGPPFVALYEEEELALDPYWLAIEPSYRVTVLDPQREHKTGTKMLQDHRFNVIRVIGQLKRSRTMQRLVFHSRQKMMPFAVEQVLSYFGLRPDDLLYTAAPVTDPMVLWIQIGRTIQHYHCWRFIEGDDSYFKHKNVKQAHIGS
jgi:hypothetical protein